VVTTAGKLHTSILRYPHGVCGSGCVEDGDRGEMWNKIS
jgi:hypothetical protein